VTPLLVRILAVSTNRRRSERRAWDVFMAGLISRQSFFKGELACLNSIRAADLRPFPHAASAASIEDKSTLPAFFPRIKRQFPRQQEADFGF
jgi:hypothetical protein